MGNLIDLELERARRAQEAQEMAELEQMAREEGITVRELVQRMAKTTDALRAQTVEPSYAPGAEYVTTIPGEQDF